MAKIRQSSSKPTRSKSVKSKKSETITFGSYLEALNDYWRADYKQSMERVSQWIADTFDEPSVLQHYRLWVETLACLGAKSDLNELIDHLLTRSTYGESFSTDLNAIRAMAHLECDEIEAARLISKSVSKQKNNSNYSIELKCLMNLRLSDQVPVIDKSTINSCTDYISLMTFGKSLVAYSRESQMNVVLDRVKSVFPASPLSMIFEMHLNFESGLLDAASLEAHKLTLNFPENPDFNFFASYFAYRRHNFNESIARLEQARRVVGSHDADIEILSSLSERELARRHPTEQSVEHAKKSLSRAISVLKESGLPVAQLDMRLQKMVEDQLEVSTDSENAEDMEATRVWLVRMSPRRYYELATAEEREIEFVTRPLGGQARSGDIVLFAGDQHTHMANDRRKNNRQWKVQAIYAVVSSPMFHPLNRYESGLQLISRLANPIPVDVLQGDAKELTSDEIKQLPKDHPVRFGIFELEMGALDIITEAISQKRTNYEYENQESQELRVRKLS